MGVRLLLQRKRHLMKASNGLFKMGSSNKLFLPELRLTRKMFQFTEFPLSNYRRGLNKLKRTWCRRWMQFKVLELAHEGREDWQGKLRLRRLYQRGAVARF